MSIKLSDSVLETWKKTPEMEVEFSLRRGCSYYIPVLPKTLILGGISSCTSAVASHVWTRTGLRPGLVVLRAQLKTIRWRKAQTHTSGNPRKLVVNLFISQIKIETEILYLTFMQRSCIWISYQLFHLVSYCLNFCYLSFCTLLSFNLFRKYT